jgi:hypothetical protein
MILTPDAMHGRELAEAVEALYQKCRHVLPPDAGPLLDEVARRMRRDDGLMLALLDRIEQVHRLEEMLAQPDPLRGTPEGLASLATWRRRLREGAAEDEDKG